MTKRVYIIAKRRVALHVERDDHISTVATARHAERLRRKWPDTLNVRELLPADRTERTRYDPAEQVLHLSGVSLLDLALWLVGEGRLPAPKLGRNWRMNMIHFEEWFGSDGRGDRAGAMVREGIDLVMPYGDRLPGMSAVLRDETYSGAPNAWDAMRSWVAACGTIVPPETIEVT